MIFGVPFDNTSSFRRGSRLAPAAIRYAYRNLESFDHDYSIDFAKKEICDLGDMTEEEDSALVVDSVASLVAALRHDGKIPIMLGGEHSITGGSMRNFTDCSMIIIDAHSDFRDSYFDNKNNHACVTRRCLELLGPGKITSFGTRSISKEEYEDPAFSDVRFVFAREIREKGMPKVVQEIDASISNKIYFSIDMDGIDPAFAPGVGTPEPYGLLDSDVRYLIEHFSRRIMGFDIVEMTPLYDNGNTAMLAAKFIQNFIGSRESAKSD